MAALPAILACIDTDPGRVRTWLANVLRVATPEQKGCSVAGPEGKGGRCLGPIEKRRRARREARMRRIAAVREEALARIRAAVERALGDDGHDDPERLRTAVEALFRAVEEWPMILAEIIAEDAGDCADWIGEVTIALAGMLSARINRSVNKRLAAALREEEPVDPYSLLLRQLPGATFLAVRDGRTPVGVKALVNKVANVIAGPRHQPTVPFPDFDATADISTAANVEARTAALDAVVRLVADAGGDARDVTNLSRFHDGGYTWEEVAARDGRSVGRLKNRAPQLRDILRSPYRDPDRAA